MHIPERGRLEEGVRPSLPLLLSSLFRVTLTAVASSYCLINFYSGHLQDSPTESALGFWSGINQCPIRTLVRLKQCRTAIVISISRSGKSQCILSWAASSRAPSPRSCRTPPPTKSDVMFNRNTDLYFHHLCEISLQNYFGCTALQYNDFITFLVYEIFKINLNSTWFHSTAQPLSDHCPFHLHTPPHNHWVLSWLDQPILTSRAPRVTPVTSPCLHL